MEVGDVLTRQVPLVTQAPLALLSVTVGVNDAAGHYRRARFAERLDELLGALRRRCDTVLIPTLPDITLVAQLEHQLLTVLRARLEDASRIIREAAGRHDALCLDVWAMPELRQEDRWSEDRLHPGPRGHQAIAEGFAELLVQRGLATN